MTKKYHLERETKLAARYRLKRRGHEVIQAIKKYCPEAKTILDVGTADGLMLSRIKEELSQTECIGLEYSKELIKTCRNKNIEIIQGDAQNMPFEDNFFDVIYATALIEHLEQPMKMLKEAHRVLKPGGIIIITTPDPFFDKIAQAIGHIEKDLHQETFTIQKLRNCLDRANFKILETKKFMMSLIGFPFELKIGEIIRFLKLDFILLNQLIVGGK